MGYSLNMRVELIAALCLVALSSLPAPAAGAPDADASPFAQVHPVGINEVRWTEGFWANRFELCRQRIIPGLEAIMEGTNYSQFYQNFRIAAGLAEGRHRGASFNDGDFYKWLEAACATAAISHETTLSQRIEEIIGVIAKAQRADGYLHTPVLIAARTDGTKKPFEDRLQFETYNMGHLLTAACVHYEATSRTNFLLVARKTADFLCETFEHPTPELARFSICPSHYMGMVEMYRATHEPRYLECAKKLLVARDLVTNGDDDNQDRVPFGEQTNAMGHAVRANYLYAGAADLFLETGDSALWKPLERIWTNVVQQKMYLTGGCGALYDGASPDGSKDQKNISRVHQSYGRNYQLPNLTAHSETCANIGNVFWNWRMFLATGEAKFMDVLELALYNSVLSGVDLGGTNFFYVNPLRKVERMPVALRWKNERVPFMSSFCCPPNLARTIAESGGYAYGKSRDAIWVNLYSGSSLVTRLDGGQTVMLTQETQYPWNGRVRIMVNRCGASAFALKLRVPGWSKNATVRLNGHRTHTSPMASSYLELNRIWHPGDTVEIDFPMPVRLIEANPLVEEAENQVAVQRGPLVYCLESSGVAGRSAAILNVVIPEDIELRPRFDHKLLGGITVLEGKAFLHASADWTGKLYRQLQPASLKPAKIQLVPYFAWGNRGAPEMSVWLPLVRK